MSLTVIHLCWMQTAWHGFIFSTSEMYFSTIAPGIAIFSADKYFSQGFRITRYHCLQKEPAHLVTVIFPRHYTHDCKQCTPYVSVAWIKNLGCHGCVPFSFRSEDMAFLTRRPLLKIQLSIQKNSRYSNCWYQRI